MFTAMGASNHSEAERQSEDFYATDPAVLDLLSRKYKIPEVVMEPACGEGHLSEWLKNHGHKVYSYDIMDRGYGERQNFFEMLTIPDDCACILTNPPYKYATEFVLHSLELVPVGGHVVMFLKTTFLETERRYNEIFKFTPPPLCFPVHPSSHVCQERGFRGGEEDGKRSQLCLLHMGERIQRGYYN